MTISDSDLLNFNSQGIIPGPNEDEESFIARAAYCHQLKELCTNPEESGLLPCEQGQIASDLMEEAFKTTKPLYGIAPMWTPIAFSNYRLAPWHGGCAWIFQARSDSPTGALLQLRQSFRQCPKLFGMYRRDELIAHELSHVGRMQFGEPQYEELLAYRSSNASWRRWLGPIVQSPRESALFLLCLLLILMLDVYLQFAGLHETYQHLAWTKAIPIGLLLAGLIRVGLRQRTFKQCLSNLNQISQNNEKANAIAYRLTDAEINQFACISSNSIKAYAQEQNSLRWRLINLILYGRNGQQQMDKR